MDYDLHKFSKTRLAPTPSGYLHLGNLLSFVLTAGLARQHGASLLLRIDDMDRQRMRPAYIEGIFETIDFLGIRCDEGPVGPQDFSATFSQLYRKPLYDFALERLRSAGLIFACICSRSQLGDDAHGNGYPGTCLSTGIPLDQPGVAWRINTDRAASIVLRNLEGGLETHPFPASMRHFVVRKKDGDPAYQICSLVDDLHFGVDLVVRGADLHNATLAQLYLAECLGETTFLQASFVHHGLLKNAEGGKMSKSAGDTSIHALRQQGRDRAAVFRQAASLLGLDVHAANWEDLFAQVRTTMLSIHL